VSKFLIYALVDPLSNGVRYIGKSSRAMVRPRSHFCPSNLAKDRSHKGNWIRSLRDWGLLPTILILESFASHELLSDAECFWISQGKGIGWDLTNLTQGGEGVPGRPFSAESRAKVSAKNKGRKMSLETRSRMSAASKARVTPTTLAILEAARRDPAVRVRAAATNTGRRMSDETRARMSAAQRGRTFSAETRQKMRLAKLGRPRPPRRANQ
jgi:hypothetical protein